MAEGFLFSVEVRIPGSKRSCRLIDAQSLDNYLLRLGREQQVQRESVTKMRKSGE